MGSTTQDADLQAACTISGQLDIDDGDFDTNNNAVTVTGAAIIYNGGEFDCSGDSANHDIGGRLEIQNGGLFNAGSASGDVTIGALTLISGGTFTGAAGSKLIIDSEYSNFAADLEGTYTSNSNTMEIKTNANTEVDLKDDKVYNLITVSYTHLRAHET